jgi:hypothetical protein
VARRTVSDHTLFVSGKLSVKPVAGTSVVE